MLASVMMNDQRCPIVGVDSPSMYCNVPRCILFPRQVQAQLLACSTSAAALLATPEIPSGANVLPVQEIVILASKNRRLSATVTPRQLVKFRTVNLLHESIMGKRPFSAAMLRKILSNCSIRNLPVTLFPASSSLSNDGQFEINGAIPSSTTVWFRTKTWRFEASCSAVSGNSPSSS